jgi:hypothetical protein
MTSSRKKKITKCKISWKNHGMKNILNKKKVFWAQQILNK